MQRRRSERVARVAQIPQSVEFLVTEIVLEIRIRGRVLIRRPLRVLWIVILGHRFVLKVDGRFLKARTPVLFPFSPSAFVVHQPRDERRRHLGGRTRALQQFHHAIGQLLDLIVDDVRGELFRAHVVEEQSALNQHLAPKQVIRHLQRQQPTRREETQADQIRDFRPDRRVHRHRRLTERMLLELLQDDPQRGAKRVPRAVLGHRLGRILKVELKRPKRLVKRLVRAERPGIVRVDVLVRDVFHHLNVVRVHGVTLVVRVRVSRPRLLFKNRRHVRIRRPAQVQTRPIAHAHQPTHEHRGSSL